MYLPTVDKQRCTYQQQTAVDKQQCTYQQQTTVDVDKQQCADGTWWLYVNSGYRYLPISNNHYELKSKYIPPSIVLPIQQVGGLL